MEFIQRNYLLIISAIATLIPILMLSADRNGIEVFSVPLLSNMWSVTAITFIALIAYSIIHSLSKKEWLWTGAIVFIPPILVVYLYINYGK